MREFSAGYPIQPRDYGTIPKCPYCPKTDIKRTHKLQVTCADVPCKKKHKAKIRKLRDADALRRQERSRAV